VTDEDRAFAEKRKRFYEDFYHAGEPMDPWHAYAQGIVHSTTRTWFRELVGDKGGLILNAGSGGIDYGIRAPMIHLDLAPTRISRFPGYIVGDISEIPAEDSLFDVVLCVGSVLNYGNPVSGLREFQRVLRPGGILILEYERSGSPEYWQEHGLSSACTLVDSFYGSIKTQLWVYADRFIDELLKTHHFKTLKERRFHGLSSILLAITSSPKIASRFTFADQHLSRIWPFRYVASNRMLAVKKLAD
jgi:SAM-dependent methyltransferase